MRLSLHAGRRTLGLNHPIAPGPGRWRENARPAPTCSDNAADDYSWLQNRASPPQTLRNNSEHGPLIHFWAMIQCLFLISCIYKATKLPPTPKEPSAVQSVTLQK